MKNNFKFLDFNALLLEYYKELNINNDELLILLMANHLIEEGEITLTNELFEIKLNMSFAEIDNAFNSLLTKKYITFETINDEFGASLKNIKNLLFNLYKKDLLNIDNFGNKKENADTRKELISSFEHYFERELTSSEIDYVYKWLENGIKQEMILDALKDSYNLNHLSLKNIDSIIAKKLKEEESE